MGKDEAQEGTSRDIVKSSDRDAIVTLRSSGGQSYTNVKLLISYLPDTLRDAIKDTGLSRRKWSAINNSVRAIQSGIWATMPMICAGSKCPYGDRCPLGPDGLQPVGMDCPLEKYLIGSWIDEYCQALGVNTENKIEMGQVGTIVMCDLMLNRVHNWMGRRPDGHVEENAIGIDNKGNVILSRDISKEVTIAERYDKIRQRNLEALLATRESKAKYDLVDDTDPSKASVTLRAQAEAIIAKARRKGAKADFLAGIAKDQAAGEIVGKARERESEKASEDEEPDYYSDSTEGDEEIAGERDSE